MGENKRLVNVNLKNEKKLLTFLEKYITIANVEKKNGGIFYEHIS